jgi:hypothetical protein
MVNIDYPSCPFSSFDNNMKTVDYKYEHYAIRGNPYFAQSISLCLQALRKTRNPEQAIPIRITLIEMSPDPASLYPARLAARFLRFGLADSLFRHKFDTPAWQCLRESAWRLRPAVDAECHVFAEALALVPLSAAEA